MASRTTNAVREPGAAPKPKPHYPAIATGCASAFATAGPAALADYELLELLLFRSIPRADTKPIAKALLTRFGSLAEVLGAPDAPAAGGRGRRRGGRARSQDRRRRRPAHGARRDQGPRGAVVMDPGDRLLPRGHGLRGARAVPHPLPRQEERADRRRGAADRNRRPHAGLSARGGPPRARAVGDRRSFSSTTIRRATRRRRAPTSR